MLNASLVQQAGRSYFCSDLDRFAAGYHVTLAYGDFKFDFH
jgi:hypothetical protein